MSMTTEAAAEIATQGLIFLADRPEDLGAFLAETGAAADDLRAAAQDPQMLGFVLAHISSREDLAEAFCIEQQLSPDQLAGARATLLGGETHWT